MIVVLVADFNTDLEVQNGIGWLPLVAESSITPFPRYLMTGRSSSMLGNAASRM